MTEQIDHAAEARRALAAATETPAEGVVSDPWLLAAQVHATLALVEQQRIANLLALAQFEWGTDGNRLFTKGEFAMELRTEASTLLGFGKKEKNA